MNTIQLDGDAADRFTPLADEFRSLLRAHGETGAAIAVYQGGERVVDMYGSHGSTQGEWHADDRVCTMSACKGPLALCVHLLHERGALSLDDPVAQYWPAFDNNGKGAITVAMLLNHTSGLPIVREVSYGNVFSWSTMCEALAATSPEFPPGERLVYHAITFGHLVGELIRRVDGRMPSVFFDEEIAQPLGIEYALRFRSSDRIRAIAPNARYSGLPLWLYSRVFSLLPSWKMQFFKPCSTAYHPNSAQWARSEVPAVTGQGSARGLAKFYAFLAGDGRLAGDTLCSPSTVAQLRQCSVEALEASSGLPWRMGAGFMLNSPEFCSFGPNPNSFGHMGMGGAAGFADPDAALSFAYVTEQYHHPNKHDKSVSGQRLQRLVEALYRCRL
ncbi:MAG TPA: hypothetical protein DD979_04620 [Gammaproteobacteria bacterium]|jgi:CubicO group peptidase (beta-lactamase class C family)|nr:hypothetical protein [Gammaproteobacteria bacterium]